MMLQQETSGAMKEKVALYSSKTLEFGSNCVSITGVERRALCGVFRVELQQLIYLSCCGIGEIIGGDICMCPFVCAIVVIR